MSSISGVSPAANAQMVQLSAQTQRVVEALRQAQAAEMAVLKVLASADGRGVNADLTV